MQYLFTQMKLFKLSLVFVYDRFTCPLAPPVHLVEPGVVAPLTEILTLVALLLVAVSVMTNTGR